MPKSQDLPVLLRQPLDQDKRASFHRWRRFLTITTVAGIAVLAFLTMRVQPSWARAAEAPQVTGRSVDLTTARGAQGNPAVKVRVNGRPVALDVKNPGQLPEATFHGRKGELIDAVDSKLETSDFGCGTLSLFNPAGKLIAKSPSFCTSSNLINAGGVGPLTLKSTGTWTLRLQVDLTATATSQLWVSAPASVVKAKVNGRGVALDVKHFGQLPEATFRGRKGELIDAVDSKLETSDFGCGTLSLFNPAGKLIAKSPSFCTSSNLPNAGGVGPLTLKSTGTWTLRLQVDLTATATSKLNVSS